MTEESSSATQSSATEESTTPESSTEESTAPESSATEESTTAPESSATEESTTVPESSATEESTTVPESSTTEESTTPAPTTPSTDQSVDTGNGTGSSTPAPTPTPTPEQPKPVTPAPAPSGSVNGAAIVEAYKYIGTPYVWGGKDPSGFDCSGFTRYVYMQVTGRDIGGWTVPQESAGTKFQFLKQKLETCYSGVTRRNLPRSDCFRRRTIYPCSSTRRKRKSWFSSMVCP